MVTFSYLEWYSDCYLHYFTEFGSFGDQQNCAAISAITELFVLYDNVFNKS